jgi:hypothetical protein
MHELAREILSAIESLLSWNSGRCLPVGDAVQLLQDVPARAGFPGRIDFSCRPRFPVILPPDRFIPPEASQFFMSITAMLTQDPTLAEKFVEGCFAARPCLEAWGCLAQFLAQGWPTKVAELVI